MNNFNPMMIINAIKSGQNPQQIMLQILQDKMGTTPLGVNLINLAKDNKNDEIEQIARNICKQRGVDFDNEFSAFKKFLGIK